MEFFRGAVRSERGPHLGDGEKMRAEAPKVTLQADQRVLRNGNLSVTTHRICWTSDRMCVAVPVSELSVAAERAKGFAQNRLQLYFGASRKGLKVEFATRKDRETIEHAINASRVKKAWLAAPAPTSRPAAAPSAAAPSAAAPPAAPPAAPSAAATTARTQPPGPPQRYTSGDSLSLSSHSVHDSQPPSLTVPSYNSDYGTWNSQLGGHSALGYTTEPGPRGYGAGYPPPPHGSYNYAAPGYSSYNGAPKQHPQSYPNYAAPQRENQQGQGYAGHGYGAGHGAPRYPPPGTPYNSYGDTPPQGPGGRPPHQPGSWGAWGMGPTTGGYTGDSSAAPPQQGPPQVVRIGPGTSAPLQAHSQGGYRGPAPHPANLPPHVPAHQAGQRPVQSGQLPPQPPANARAAPQTPPSMAMGIGGVIAKEKEKEHQRDAQLNAAFSDLDGLMANAKGLVDIAQKFSALRLQDPNAAPEDEEFASMMTEIGIENPVSKSAVGGSRSNYYNKLARELGEFLREPLNRLGGVMTLSDVYCVYNRARSSTELVAPEDVLKACERFSKVGIDLRLAKLDSKVMVVQSADFMGEKGADRVLQLIEQRGSMSALDLASDTNVPLATALTQMENAEKFGRLCRDEGSAHDQTDLRFYPNYFATKFRKGVAH